MRIFSSIRFGLVALGTSLSLCAQPLIAAEDAKPSPAAPEKVWPMHDPERPKPPIQAPPAPTDDEFAKPPTGAIVLFDGQDLANWERRPGPKDPRQTKDALWKVTPDYFEVVTNAGNLYTKETFKDCRIHLEWRTPETFKPNAVGQNRGNSGVFLPGRQELQILDSYENETYADGQAAAVYGKHPPTVNVCRKPGEWQSYDITLRQPRFDAQRKMLEPATLSVLHNGVLVQDRVPLNGGATSGTLGLQDHYTPVRFRNIWVLPLEAETKKSDEVKKVETEKD